MATVDLGSLKSGLAGPREPIEVDAAFMVIIRGNGVIQASPDINAPITPRREPTIDEMQSACHRILDDIQASKTAQMVQMGMQQVAASAFNAAENRRVANSLKL